MLSTKESKFLQSLELTREFDAHTGLNIPAMHKLGGVSEARIGIPLMPDIVRVEEVFADQLHAPKGGTLPRDCDITTQCPTCAQVQTLQEAEVFLDGDDTIYLCKNGCQPIVVVGPPGGSPWPERSYRLGQHVIVNAKDLFFKVSNALGEIVFPASLAALMEADKKIR